MIDIILAGLLVGLIELIKEYTGITLPEHKIEQLFHTSTIPFIILFGVIIMPIIEEILFRLPLHYPANFFRWIILAPIALGGKEKKIRTEAFLKSIWIRYYSWIFYFTAAIFAGLHLANFNSTDIPYAFCLILVFPQFMFGIFAAYLRVRFGFWWGYSLHVLHNGLILIVPLLMMGEAKEKLNIKSDSFELQISEPQFVHESSAYFGTDSICYQATPIKTIIANILDVEESSLASKSASYFKKPINFAYKVKLGKMNKKHVMDWLKTTYKFSVESKTRIEEIWVLSIEDSLKLQAFQKENNLLISQIVRNEKQLELKNADLDELCSSLSLAYLKPVQTKTSEEKHYNFQLALSTEEALKLQLLQTYGIRITAAKSPISYYELNPY